MLYAEKNKRVKLFFYICLCAALLPIACKNTGESSERVEEIRPGANNIAELIRNPATSEAPTDTVNVPKIRFDHTSHDFGDVEEGDIVNHTFPFTNVGKTPLAIAHVRSSCGCTSPNWPKSPIPPGGKGEIEVRFDSNGREGASSKPVVVTANTYPSTTTLNITVNVKASTKKDN
ncbi:MAG: DUF1573 domain-containing protein [Saprospiraceae bacterium]|nr:DUF1573 domain-containing protein [Saprospiraceae bacterium]